MNKYIFEIEEYSKGKLKNNKINFKNVWKNNANDITKISLSISYQLLKDKINYSLLLENVLNKILDISESNIGSISLHLKEDISYLICLALGDKDGNFSNCKTVNNKRKVSGLSSYSINNDKIIISDDLKTDPREDKTIILPENHPEIKQIIIIPLKRHNKIIGLLNIANPKKKVYSQSDIEKIVPLFDIITLLIKKVNEDYIRSITSVSSITRRINKTQNDNDEKDKFLATMSHELRTPLNGILGMITMLPDAGPLNEKQRQYVLNLTECAANLTHLLNNILDFSKMTSNRLLLIKKSLNIKEMIQDVIKMNEGNAIAKGLKININLPEYIPKVVGDKNRLTQILINLINNAIKFTDKGTVEITIKIKKIIFKDSSVKYKITFEIKDTGIGIPFDEQDKIFEIFHQSSSLNTYLSKSGTGLGLSIVRELVRLMGGKISVSSEGIIGKGSTFSFFIILDEEIDIKTLTEKNKGLLVNSKILIVDDRPEMRLQLTELMFKWGCIPHAVSSADEALQYLSYDIEFKVALIDICMPHMSGVELAQELHMKYKNLALIGISSIELNSGEEYFDFYMYKPIDQNILFPALVNCLNKKSVCRTTNQRVKKNKSELKIAIAEDDRYNTFTIKEMLVNIGFKIENIYLSNNGKECLDIIKKIDVDCVLMDIIMPGMDGIEATRIIKKEFIKPPMIIAVSAAVRPKDKEKCHRVGIDGYLSKPITKEKLEGALSPLIK